MDVSRLVPSTRPRALTALALATLLFGVTVPLSKVALAWLDPAWLAAVRFGLAAPLLAIVARRGLRGAASPAVAAWGAAGYGGLVLLQNLGIERTSVVHAALILGTVPALVALITVLTGRSSAGPLARVGFAVALGGVTLVAGSGGAASPAGDALVLAAAVLSALFTVAQADLLAGRDPAAVTAVQMAGATALTLPVALAGGLPAGGAAPAALAAVAALVVAGTLIPFALFAYGQACVPAETAGAFVNLEPLVGAGVGILAFHDPLGAAQTAGALAIVAGLALSLRTAGGDGGDPRPPAAAGC